MGRKLSVKQLPCIQDIVASEGMRSSLSCKYTGSYTVGAAFRNWSIGFSGDVGSYGAVNSNKMFYVDSITIFSSKALQLRIAYPDPVPNIFQGANDNITPNSFSRWKFDFFIAKNQTIILPINNFFFIEKEGVQGIVIEDLDPSDTSVFKFSALFNGYNVSYNRKWNTNRVLLWIGDSIANGTGASAIGKVNAPYTHTVKRWLNEVKQYDCRMCNKAQSSMTTSSFIRALEWEYYSIDSADMIMFQLGANDANNLGSGGLSTPANQTIFRDNIKKAISFKQSMYPSSIMLMLGSTPSADNTTENNIIIGRTIMSEEVSLVADPKIKYLSLANSFDRTNPANYLPSDTIHPVAQDAIASTITTYLNTIM